MKFRIQIGDEAPEFVAQSQDGNPIRLSDYRGKSVVVLYFYPRDNTPSCTDQACSFRDAYQDFTEFGAVVIGVSNDSADRHEGFASKHRLPFLLASDSQGKIRRSFGVPKTFGFLPGRVTYVIDREGVVRHIFNSQWRAKDHISEALEVVKKLAR